MAVIVTDQLRPLNPLAVGLACLAVGALLARVGVTMCEDLRLVARSRGEALTDALSGLGNRRRLVADLERLLAGAPAGGPRVLLLFDLDGFKRPARGLPCHAGAETEVRVPLSAAARGHLGR